MCIYLRFLSSNNKFSKYRKKKERRTTNIYPYKVAMYMQCTSIRDINSPILALRLGLIPDKK